MLKKMMILMSIFLFVLESGAQVLMYLPAGLQDAGIEASWKMEFGEGGFALISDSEMPAARNLGAVPLDERTEFSDYYLVDARFGSVPDPESLPGDVLWSSSEGLLVRISKNLFRPDFPPDAKVRRLFISPVPPKAHASVPRLSPAATGSWVRALMDSISISRLMTTVRRLSGEEPTVPGGQDTIHTRYSYSDGVGQAGDYLKTRFIDLGYAVEEFKFALAGYSMLSWDPDDPDRGFGIASGRLYCTEDGGRTWDAAGLPDRMAGIWTSKGGTVFALGEERLWILEGSGWTSFPMPVVFQSGFFLDSRHGWFCGEQGRIFRTQDGGRTWEETHNPSGEALYDFCFIDIDKGWASGRYGTILSTEDGGRSWIQQNTPCSGRLYGIHFFDENTGVAAGGDCVLRTEDGGRGWKKVEVPGIRDIRSMAFSGDLGILACQDGTILRSGNQGIEWETDPSRVPMPISFVSLQGERLWAGGAGYMACQERSGDSWKSQFMSDIYPQYNIIAEKTGTKHPNIQLILCAHYDSITRTNPTVRAPGADDNATGVATVLEAARVMANMDFEYTVKFILFSAEEQGMIGSSYYAMWAYNHVHDIRAVINLDMVGYDSNADGRFEIHSGYLYFSQRLGSTIAQNETNWNLGLTSRLKVGSASTSASDHSPFWNYGYPAVLMIEDFQEFNPFYHQATDLSTHLRQPYFLDMARLAVGSLASLAVRDSTTSPVDEGEPLPRCFRIDPPYPNPFNSSVVIPFAVSETAEYTLSIHNLLGREIRTLRLGMKTPGVHRAVWDGTDSKGDPLPSGVYLVREVLGAGEVRKIVLVR